MKAYGEKKWEWKGASNATRCMKVGDHVTANCGVLVSEPGDMSSRDDTSPAVPTRHVFPPPLSSLSYSRAAMKVLLVELAHSGGLTKADDVTKVFEYYGKGGIWGVIHVAVPIKAVEECGEIPLVYYQNNVPATAISLRYFNPAGAHRSGHISEDPRGRPGNLLLLSQMTTGHVKDAVLKQ
ncbi:hypothetical protein M422DRAFT_275027 [Sphaerobolus stellatus SS14]|uniref:Uncharacterized protein n=1 Tax=Sphaerobolus stellatus (strain SS14) TaxID=990650 RepID=A0A0C9T5Q0_SPHS4|nr:hypothetical protein M422DRAFT_275027 [Sphaerobolus stellatus SS14]